MIRSLIPIIGFRYTSFSVALVILITLGTANLVMRPSPITRPKRAFFDRTALHDAPYLLFVLGCVFAFLGLYTTFFYIAAYATETHTLDPATATYLVTVLNGASVFGRIMPNIPTVTKAAGPLNMMAAAVFALALLVLCLNAGPSPAGLWAVVSLYGLFTGAFFSLQPTIFARLTADPQSIGTRMGMASTCMSFGLLLGAPSSGALLRTFGYEASWAWSGVALFTGAVAICVSRGMAGGWKMAMRI